MELFLKLRKEGKIKTPGEPWQMKHQDRGLTYIPLNLGTAKLFVFVNGSLGNLKDFISQIRHIIILVNKFKGENKFTIKGNLINTNSTKCKRITWSSLVSEICGIVNSFDLAYVIAVTLKIIID
jgi:hypothetical protein